MSHGRCLTAQISEFPNSKKECYLGEESGGEILSFTEANPKTIVKRFGGRQGDRVYAGNGLSCTLTSSAGGFAGNTGLYFMDMKYGTEDHGACPLYYGKTGLR